jgi:hypothetical protein
MKKQDSPQQNCLSSLISYYVVPRRLEDRIRALSDRAVFITDPEEVKRVHRQLRTLLREHTSRLRRMIAGYPVFPKRRRPS